MLQVKTYFASRWNRTGTRAGTVAEGTALLAAGRQHLSMGFGPLRHRPVSGT